MQLSSALCMSRKNSKGWQRVQIRRGCGQRLPRPCHPGAWLGHRDHLRAGLQAPLDGVHPSHLPAHGHGLGEGARAGGRACCRPLPFCSGCPTPAPHAAGAAACTGLGPGGAGAGQGLQTLGGEGSALGVGRRWGQSCRGGLVLHLGGLWDLGGTRVQCGLVTLAWLPPATVLASSVCLPPGP